MSSSLCRGTVDKEVDAYEPISVLSDTRSEFLIDNLTEVERPLMFPSQTMASCSTEALKTLYSASTEAKTLPDCEIWQAK